MIKSALALTFAAGTLGLGHIPSPETVSLTAGPVEIAHKTQTGLELTRAQKPAIALMIKTQNGKAIKISF